MPNEGLVSLGQAVRVGTTADLVAMIEDLRNHARAVAKASPGRAAMKVSRLPHEWEAGGHYQKLSAIPCFRK
jgi:hypothetical protein